VKGILKAELARRHISYRDLAGRLAAIGVQDNERNIANKLLAAPSRRRSSFSV
jgi:hypothetical protein